MTDYFHRRNLPLTEYSGHADVSDELRTRLQAVLHQYVVKTTAEGYNLRLDQLTYRTQQQFPNEYPFNIILSGTYEKAFALVEITYDYAENMFEDRRASLRQQLAEAFRLSGSVYALVKGRIQLIPSQDTATKLKELQPVLSVHAACYQFFYGAVGDLMGRKRKPDDIVKDLWIGTEGYLKTISGQKDFAAALKALRANGTINAIQHAIIDKLHGYRSDAHGVGHATNSPAPTEAEALWFLETLLVQLNHIGRAVRKAAA